MSRIEYVNISGLRVDGRRPREVRRLQAELGVFHKTDGSAIFEMGNTKVLAVVHGPREATRRGEHDEAIINCEYSIAPFATSERRKRRGGDRRITEAAAALKQCFATVIESKLYARSQIDIHIQVLQSDGGAMAAAVNAGTLALIDAGIAMSDHVVGCSVAYVSRTPLLDPCYVEASSGGPELTIAVLPSTGAVTLSTMDARLPLDAFESTLDLGVAGCRQVHDTLRAAVKEHTLRRLASRGLLADAGAGKSSAGAAAAAGGAGTA